MLLCICPISYSYSLSVQIKHGFDEPLETRTPNNMIKIMYSSDWVYGSYWANRVESSILITLSSDCCIDLFASLSIRSFSLSMLRLTELVRFELTNTGIKIPCLTSWRQPYISYSIVIFGLFCRKCYEIL